MSNSKSYNPVYTSIIGGYCMKGYIDSDGSKKTDLHSWQYTCLRSKLTFSYSSVDLKYGWIHRAIHWNNVRNGGSSWDFHIAYRSKFPFLKIGFNSIKDLFKEF